MKAIENEISKTRELKSSITREVNALGARNQKLKNDESKLRVKKKEIESLITSVIEDMVNQMKSAGDAKDKIEEELVKSRELLKKLRGEIKDTEKEISSLRSETASIEIHRDELAAKIIHLSQTEELLNKKISTQLSDSDKIENEKVDNTVNEKNSDEKEIVPSEEVKDENLFNKK